MKGLLWSGAVFGDLERGAGLKCALRNIGEKTRESGMKWEFKNWKLKYCTLGTLEETRLYE